MAGLELCSSYTGTTVTSKVKKRTDKEQAFVLLWVLTHINTYILCNEFILGVLYLHVSCARSLFVYVFFMQTGPRLCVRLPIGLVFAVCWHTLTDGDRKAFILSEEFAL